MRSEEFTFKHEDGGIQRVQKVSLDSWAELNFFHPQPSGEAFSELCELYENYIVRKYSKLFGKVILFKLPEDIDVTCPLTDKQFGTVVDKLSCAAIMFKRDLRQRKGELLFLNETTKALYDELAKRGCLFSAKGDRDSLTILPVEDTLGFLSESFPEAKMKVNSSFFVMDPTDCSTVYDAVGVPFGLCVKDEAVISPPLFGREALIVDRSGKVDVRKISLSEITVKIGNTVYRNGENAVFCSRPEKKRTPGGGTDIVLRGNLVVAIKEGGNCPIPSGGFVIHIDSNVQYCTSDIVEFGKIENVIFGIQVGNSTIVDGMRTVKYISPFHSLLKFWEPMYPPALYRLNGKKYRAPRIIVGSDNRDKPIVLWIEGAGKFGYAHGVDSTGATLEEASDICEKLGLKNGIHLDGGGSAQILVDGKRILKLSDRDPDTFVEQERAVPAGLFVI